MGRTQDSESDRLGDLMKDPLILPPILPFFSSPIPPALPYRPPTFPTPSLQSCSNAARTLTQMAPTPHQAQKTWKTCQLACSRQTWGGAASEHPPALEAELTGPPCDRRTGEQSPACEDSALVCHEPGKVYKPDAGHPCDCSLQGPHARWTHPVSLSTPDTPSASNAPPRSQA